MISNYLKRKPLGAVALLFYHSLVFTLTYKILLDRNIINALPNDKNLIRWDAIWYKSIMDSGYQFVPYQTCNLAFFPLFPMVWKFLRISPLGMAFVNWCLFGLFFVFLTRKEKIPSFFCLFFLSIPSLIFFGLPYSEALFFGSATLVIVGYRSKSTLMTGIGLFLCAIVRSVSIVFIPAILIAEILSVDTHSIRKERALRILSSIIPALLGLFVAAGVQAYQTGKWFYFIEVQRFWKRNWVIPHFPLTTYAPDRIIAIDGIAFTLGIIALYYCVKIVANKMVGANPYRPDHIFNNRALLFSILYLTCTTLLDLFYTFTSEGATSIWSLNRHFFCTPFAFVFLSAALYNIEFTEGEQFIFTILILSSIYITGVYRYLDQAYYYLLFFFSLFVLKYFAKLTPFLVLVYMLNVWFQAQFYGNFLKNFWIG